MFDNLGKLRHEIETAGNVSGSSLAYFSMASLKRLVSNAYFTSRSLMLRNLTLLKSVVFAMLGNHESVYSDVRDGKIGDNANSLYDMQTREIIKKTLSSNSNSIDVGCHVGEILEWMVSASPNGTHYGFEPIPDLFQGLKKRFAGNEKVFISDIALSDACGETVFQNVISSPAYSGFRRRRYEKPNEQIEEITVKADKLDSLIPDSIKIDFIKIDVEGAELQVFRGAVETIKRCKPVIVFEHGIGAADYYGTTPMDVYDILVQCCNQKVDLMENWLAGVRTGMSRERFCDNFYSRKNYYFMCF